MLSRGHQAVADVLERNPQAILSTAAEVAREAGVNASTVVRFAVASGYRGWTEMQQVRRSAYLAGLNATETQLAHAAGNDEPPFRRSILQDLANVRQVFDAIHLDVVDGAVDAILGARRIVVAASGSYVAPAVVIAHLGSVLGLPIHLEDRSGVALASSVAHLDRGDCLVAVNLWRQTTDLVTATRYAKEREVTVVALTDTRMGIGECADHLLLVPSESTSFFQSTAAAVAVAYGVVAEMAARLGGEGEEALRRTQGAWDAMHSLGPLDRGPSS